jgi:hypothetical protein
MVSSACGIPEDGDKNRRGNSKAMIKKGLPMSARDKIRKTESIPPALAAWQEEIRKATREQRPVTLEQARAMVPPHLRCCPKTSGKS